MDRQIMVGMLLTVFVITASGCLIVSGKSIQESGVHITDTTLNQLEIGKTTEEWVLAVLGEPDSQAVVNEDENTVIFRYEHCLTRSEGGAVFLIFAGGTETITKTTTWFEFEDGILTRTWTETS